MQSSNAWEPAMMEWRQISIFISASTAGMSLSMRYKDKGTNDEAPLSTMISSASELAMSSIRLSKLALRAYMWVKEPI